MESLVIVDKNATVNTYPIFAHTARHAMGSSCIRSKKGLREKIKFNTFYFLGKKKKVLDFLRVKLTTM